MSFIDLKLSQSRTMSFFGTNHLIIALAPFFLVIDYKLYNMEKPNWIDMLERLPKGSKTDFQF